MPQSRRELAPKRTYNMQCTIFTDTSLNFILLQTRFRPKRASRAQNVSGRNIYAVGIAERLVCIERYIGTFLYFFPRCFTILFLSSERSRVLLVVPKRGGTEHSTAQRRGKIFLVRCVVGAARVYCEPAQRYIKAYIETRQTKRAPTERLRHFYTSAIDFCARSSRDQVWLGAPAASGRVQHSNLFFLHYGCFFPLLRNI